MEINFIHAAIISNYFIMQLFLLTKKKQICSQAFCANTFKQALHAWSDPNRIHLKSPKLFANIFLSRFIFFMCEYMSLWH